MDKLKLLAVFPALSFALSVVYVNILYGVGSGFVRLYTVSDYFDTAVHLMPQVVMGVIFAVLSGTFFRPAHRPNESSDQYKERTGQSGAPVNGVDWVAVGANTMCVLSVPFVEYRSIFIIITLIIMINLGYFVRFVDSSLGGRLSPLLFDGDWWLRWTGLMSAIFALYWVAASALGVQNDMFEYELNERCDELICLDGRFLVDNINAGYIVYSDEFLILVSDSGSEFVREPLVLNPRQTLSCSIFNICIFSEGDALDAAVQ